MRTKKSRAAAALLAALLTAFQLIGCAHHSTPSSETAAPSTTDPKQTHTSDDPSTAIDYSVESYRTVADKDLVCTTLRNGLTIIAKRIPSPVISVQGLCHTGSIYEGRWLGGGLTHLLEHLLAGGSNGRRTELQNQDMLENIGDNSDAYTDYDHTVFFVNTTADHMDQAVDLVTGWLFTAKIPQAEYAREYQVVQRELEKDNGEADWAFYQLTQYNRYIMHPARMPVVGYQDVIRGLSRDDVYAYYKMSYVPQNIVIGVCGNADPEAMIASVRKYAGSIPPGRVPQKAVVEEPPVASPRSAVATFPKLGQAKLELAFPSVKQNDPDMFALDVLAAILGQGESSILTEEIRDKQQLVSDIAVGDNTPSYVQGSFQIDMDLDPEKIKPATEAILAELNKIKKDGVTDDRLARAKTQLKAADAFSRQSSESVCGTLITSYIATGYPEDIVLKNYLKVTPAQVKRVANKYFNTNLLLTSALLPAESESGKGPPTAEALLRHATPTTNKAPTPETSATEDVTKLDLQDGTTVLLKRVSTSPVVSVQMYALGGVSAEDDKTNGLGNLALSCLDQGTKTRNREEIATFFDSIGGQFEATCGNNTWVWKAAFLKDDLEKGLGAFSDLVHNPTFPDEGLKAVKQRTEAAIDDQDRDWFGGGSRYFHSIFFGPSKSPYRFTPLGTKESVDKFTPSALGIWYNEKILKGKRVLAIYGDIDPTAVRSLVDKEFGKAKIPAIIDWPKINVSFGSPNTTPSVNIKQLSIQKWDNPQAAIFIGYQSNDVVLDPQRDPLILCKTLTTGYGYPTGYVFETLRGLGLVYDANADNFWGLGEKLPGAFWSYAVCDPKNVDQCLDQMLLNFARLQGSDQDIDTKWFDRAKKMIVSIDAMDNETAEKQASVAALDELYGLGYQFHDDFPQRIQKVTIDQMRNAARLRLRDCIIAVSTTNPELIKTKAGIREYKTFPKVDLTPKGTQHDVNGASAK